MSAAQAAPASIRIFTTKTFVDQSLEAQNAAVTGKFKIVIDNRISIVPELNSSSDLRAYSSRAPRKRRSHYVLTAKSRAMHR